jgi:pimeloyl-ACP methyl ester carboxylesterase
LHGIASDSTAWDPTTEFLRRTLGWKSGGTLKYLPNFDPRFGLDPLESNFLLSGDYFTVNFGDKFADYPVGSVHLGILHQGDEVGGFIRTLQSRGQISIVAHSMGGLAARACIQDPTTQCVATSKIADLVTLGTPHWGVDSSYLRTFHFVPYIAKLLGWADLPAVQSSRGLIDMDSGCVANGDASGATPVSGFLYTLNSSTLPPQIRYVVESGNVFYYNDECYPSSGKRVFTDGVVPTTSATLNGLIPTPRVWWLLETGYSHVDMTSGVTGILCALDQNCLELQVMSPVDIQVTAPNGQAISNNFTSMPGAEYMNVVNADEHETATVLIPFPQGGQYTVTATPKPGTQTTDTFTILQTQNGVTTTIAQNMQIQNIPPAGFQTTVKSGSSFVVNLGGSPQMPLTKDSNGNWVATVTVTNKGNVSVDSAQVKAAGTTLGTRAPITLPSAITNLAPGASATITITFPASAVPAGTTSLPLKISGSYTAGTLSGNWSLTFRSVSLNGGVPLS